MKKKSIWKNVVWKRVLAFAIIMLFVAGTLTPIVKKADATDDFDWAWTSGSGITGDLYRTGNVSIGTLNSHAKLHIQNGAVLFNGATGDTPVSGAGTRLMWIPSKKAFRAGRVTGSNWDDSNIGIYSVAMGLDTTASGGCSTAMGGGTIASGTYSTARGYGTIASNWYSTAMGSGTTASGDYSTAMGSGTTASGGWSTAMGYGTTASGDWSTAMGRTITVSGENSVGIGLNSTSYTVSDNNVMSIMGGDVGIGTTSPDQTLDIRGLCIIQGVNYPQYIMKSSLGGAQEWSFYGAGSGFYIRNRDNAINPFAILNDTKHKSLVIDPSEVVVNENSYDLDFRVESNGNANMLFVDAGNNRVGIGTSSPQRALHINDVMRLEPTSQPGSPQQGDIYSDSGDGHLYYYNGSSWVEIG